MKKQFDKHDFTNFIYHKTRNEDEQTVDFIKLSIYEDALLALLCDNPIVDKGFVGNIMKKIGKQM